jgi:hypothetical protein
LRRLRGVGGLSYSICWFAVGDLAPDCAPAARPWSVRSGWTSRSGARACRRSAWGRRRCRSVVSTQALADLVGNQRYRERAAAVAEEIAREGGVAAVVAIERIASRARRQAQ